MEITHAITPAAATAAGFAAYLAGDGLFGDHGQTQAHQGPYIGRQGAIGTRDEHHVVLARQTGHHLNNARVFRTGQLFYFFEQRHFLCAV
jgi:predicted PhzF superfamily epimerase YddE/YHI9